MPQKEGMRNMLFLACSMQRWKYILSKMIISVFVTVSGLIITFTGSFLYCCLTDSSFILDVPAALLCCLSSLFSCSLCIILTESVVSKREDRIISLIITIATIIVHVLMALLLPYWGTSDAACPRFAGRSKRQILTIQTAGVTMDFSGTDGNWTLEPDTDKS